MESKGLNGYTKWLVGVLFTILFTAFTTLTANVIANDKDARDRDTKIGECLNASIKEQLIMSKQMELNIKENQMMNKQILAGLLDLKEQMKHDRTRTP